jgi:predicted nucleic acid-binding protein
VIVFVETNFVLELVLRQEQHDSCGHLLNLAQQDKITIAVPAFSVVEPYQTLRRRHRDRVHLKQRLDRELLQLRRTLDYRSRLQEAEQVVALLIDSSNEQWRQLETVRQRLLQLATLLPLDSAALERASGLQNRHDLGPEDACVLASVLAHLEKTNPATACFLNRDSKDFADPDIVEELQRLKCKLIPSFDDGLAFVRSRIRRQSEAT